MSAYKSPRVGTAEPVWPARAQLGEGLCWSPSLQAIYWVDIFGQRLMRLHLETGEGRQWDFDQTISTVAERADGQGLIVALRHHVAFFDPQSGSVELLHGVEAELPANRFNDGKCDSMGRFWVGSMDTGCQLTTGSLYCARLADGKTSIACEWSAGFPVVNGPTWSPDGRTMWVNDTARNFIHRGAVDAPTGAIVEPAVWLRFGKGDGYPDGMTTDRDGRLWIAHWGGACVTCHAPDDGRELARISLPTSNITNVAFGGPDLQTLFISSATAELTDEQRANEPLAGSLFSVTTDAVGLQANRFG